MMQFFLLFPLFILFSFIAFYIPGSLIINYFIKSKVGIIISCVTGLALWGLQGWFLGLFNLNFLTYIYILATLVLWLKFNTTKIKKINFSSLVNFILKENLTIITLIAGIAIQLPAAWFFGIINPYGMSFTSNMPSDLQWQASLIYQLTRSIPPNEPGMFNVLVTNYHYFGNLIIAEFIKIFNLPLITTTFQYFSLVLSLFVGLSAIAFTRTYKLGKNIEILLLILLFTGGDIIPYVMSLLGHGFNFEMSALESGADLLTNYPRAFSVIFMLTALALIKFWFEKRNLVIDIAISVLITASICSKVNTGIFILPGLAIICTYFIIKKRFPHLFLLIFSAILTSLIYIPINKDAGGLIFTGFWRAQDFIVQPKLGLSNLELAREVYARNNNYIKDLLYNLLFTLIFTIAIFGTKIIGFFQTKTSLKKLPTYLHIILLSGLIMCFILGMFFVQVSGGANSFNFISTVFIFSSIYAALAMAFLIRMPKHKIIRFTILTIFILITMTRSIYVSTRLINLHVSKTYNMPVEELSVYEFIKTNIPNEEIFLNGDFQLSFIGNKNIYFPTGFSNGVLSSHGVNTKERDALFKKILLEKNPSVQKKIIQQLGIKYAYISPNDKLLDGLSDKIYSIIYSEKNQKVIKFNN